MRYSSNSAFQMENGNIIVLHTSGLIIYHFSTFLKIYSYKCSISLHLFAELTPKLIVITDYVGNIYLLDFIKGILFTKRIQAIQFVKILRISDLIIIAGLKKYVF